MSATETRQPVRLLRRISRFALASAVGVALVVGGTPTRAAATSSPQANTTTQVDITSTQLTAYPTAVALPSAPPTLVTASHPAAAPTTRPAAGPRVEDPVKHLKQKLKGVKDEARRRQLQTTIKLMERYPHLSKCLKCMAEKWLLDGANLPRGVDGVKDFTKYFSECGEECGHLLKLLTYRERLLRRHQKNYDRVRKLKQQLAEDPRNEELKRKLKQARKRVQNSNKAIKRFDEHLRLKDRNKKKAEKYQKLSKEHFEKSKKPLDVKKKKKGKDKKAQSKKNSTGKKNSKGGNSRGKTRGGGKKAKSGLPLLFPIGSGDLFGKREIENLHEQWRQSGKLLRDYIKKHPNEAPKLLEEVRKRHPRDINPDWMRMFLKEWDRRHDDKTGREKQKSICQVQRELGGIDCKSEDTRKESKKSKKSKKSKGKDLVKKNRTDLQEHGNQRFTDKTESGKRPKKSKKPSGKDLVRKVRNDLQEHGNQRFTDKTESGKRPKKSKKPSGKDLVRKVRNDLQEHGNQRFTDKNDNGKKSKKETTTKKKGSGKKETKKDTTKKETTKKETKKDNGKKRPDHIIEKNSKY